MRFTVGAPGPRGRQDDKQNIPVQEPESSVADPGEGALSKVRPFSWDLNFCNSIPFV